MTVRAQLRKLARAIGLRPNDESGRRAFTTYEDDVMIVSYPRSGNTWTRFLVANLLDPADPATFDTIHDRVPPIYRFRDRQLAAFARPRVLKSHEYLDPRYRRVIYLVRDPRDVAHSYYRLKIRVGRIPPEYAFDRFVTKWFEGEWDGYGTWSDHVGGWLGARDGSSDFVLVRYEDLRRAPVEELARMDAVLPGAHSPADITAAVEQSEADRMRNLHREHVASGKTFRDVRTDREFIKAGESGGRAPDIPAEQAVRIATRYRSLMDRLGYSD